MACGNKGGGKGADIETIGETEYLPGVALGRAITTFCLLWSPYSLSPPSSVLMAHPKCPGLLDHTHQYRGNTKTHGAAFFTTAKQNDAAEIAALSLAF